MPLDIANTIDVIASVLNPTTYVQNLVAAQRLGIGGAGGNDYQATATWDTPTNITSGTFFMRFTSATVTGATTKGDIGNTLASWPLSDQVSAAGGSGTFSTQSAANLASGTGYTCVVFWANDLWANRLIAGTHTIADMVTADNLAPGTVCQPAGDGIFASNTVTIQAVTSPATNIVVTGSVVESAAAGSSVGQATADRSDGTNPWSLINTPPAWLEIDADSGALSVAAGQTAPATAGPVAVTLQYDNSAISGGGTYSQTVNVSVTVAPVGGNAPGYIAAPTDNTGQTGLTAAQLQAELAALTSNWSATMGGYGLATSGVEPVLTLAAGTVAGDLVLSNYGPFPETVHIRGSGTFTGNAYKPLGGTRYDRIRASNCEDISIWLMHFEDAQGRGHTATNCDDFGIYRSLIANDVAENAADLATRPSITTLYDMTNSSNMTVKNCVLMAVSSHCFSGPNVTNVSDVLIEGCIFDQFANDVFSLHNGGVCPRWTIRKCIYGLLRQPNVTHRDFAQLGNGVLCQDWVWDRVWSGCLGWTGSKGNVSNKLQQVSGGAQSGQNHVWSHCICVTGFFGIDGSTGKHSGGSARNVSVFASPAVDAAAERYETGDTTFRANTGIKSGVGTVEDCVIVTTSSSSAVHAANGGVNALVLNNAGFVGVGESGYDWGDYASLFENYNMPADPVADIDQIVPSHRNYRIGGWKPAVGGQLHWGHANPKGAFELMRDLFDTNNPDNWRGYGWPVAHQAAEQFDSLNELAGAIANQTFDANGD